MGEATSLTDLIQRAQHGDEPAMRQVFDAAYADLRAIARARLSKGGRNTLLDTTALVHESYLRFINSKQLQIADRKHFLRYAAHVMRSIVVDLIRQQRTERHGGSALHVTIDTSIGDDVVEKEDEILRVHEALEDLARYDRRLVEVVEMRYFGGMSDAEIADALGVSDRTVRRDWDKARLILASALR